MIEFDRSKLVVDFVQLKTITTALGGSMSIIDQEKSTPDEEVTTRFEVPMAVARAFIASTKFTKYLKPVWCAILRYGDHIVAMERHPLVALGTLEIEGPFGVKPWVPHIQHQLNDVVDPLVNIDRRWYFDGRYLYALGSDATDDVIRDAEFLSADGHFRKVIVDSVDLMMTSRIEPVQVTERNSLAVVTSTGEYTITPPIWKSLSGVGQHQMKGNVGDEVFDDDDDSTEYMMEFPFDDVEQQMRVNLNFALKAGREIGQLFGYERVEPLQLSRLMIELHTVNLPNISKDVKKTYDCGLSFKHAMSWVAGMLRHTDTLDTALVIRSLLSYLSKKGIFRNNAFHMDSIYLPGKTHNDINVRCVNELIDGTDRDQQAIARIMASARQDIERNRSKHKRPNNVANER